MEGRYISSRAPASERALSRRLNLPFTIGNARWYKGAQYSITGPMQV